MDHSEHFGAGFPDLSGGYLDPTLQFSPGEQLILHFHRVDKSSGVIRFFSIILPLARFVFVDIELAIRYGHDVLTFPRFVSHQITEREDVSDALDRLLEMNFDQGKIILGFRTVYYIERTTPIPERRDSRSEDRP